MTEGSKSSEFKLVMLPVAGALGVALLEWADKLPEWARSENVLISAMQCGTVVIVAYVLSRGIAKTRPK